MQLTFNPNRLRAERVAIGLSQEEVANLLGKKRSWYAKRESGAVNTGSDELADIANVLKIEDISIFFTKIVPEKQQT